MIIKTITCHDVYNVGASLQAYALQHYLEEQGHKVEIIDYKPDYLSKHYKITAINNPRFDRLIIRQIYILAKLPTRILALFDKRKKRFDYFRKEYLKLTSVRYCSNEELKKNPPAADIYIVGSDQIWNPLFQNGKDPTFFLDFVSKGKKCASYAASFATKQIPEDDKKRMAMLLRKFNRISVREKSSLVTLGEMGIKNAEVVCDPVFLLAERFWESLLISPLINEKYLFVYDFDNSSYINEQILRVAKARNLKIFSFFKSSIADKVLTDVGPLEFLGIIKNADIIVSNSFHATAFSLIFHKDFYVANRIENINIRMSDLLENVGLANRMIDNNNIQLEQDTINWSDVDEKMSKIIKDSKNYLSSVCCTD